MKDIESLIIKYIGYKEPSTEEEVELEILGLRTSIAAAGQRIAVLEQSLKLQEIVQKSKAEGTTDEKAITSSSSKDK